MRYLCLTAVELSFRLIDVFVRKNWSDICYGGYSPKIMPDDAIDSLNIRFKEASVGYQYVSGEIIRVDLEILHSEAVKPALSLLRDKRYNGANDEFLSAHAHYRNGKYKECLTDCTKAFESTMKVICDKRKWTYASGDTANKLVKCHSCKYCSYRQVLANAFHILVIYAVKWYFQLQETKLLPMVKGGDIRDVPQYLASYVLHQAAATILMLIEADKSMR